MDLYRTLAGEVSASITEKKSEFIATAAPAQNEAEALALLSRVKAEHRTARHNVYAYILREGARQRYSDDGEPAKTAGLPVLSVLEHADLKDCIIVVTRYFGGVLLGTGGLVRAYTTAAKAVLEKAEVLTVTPCVRLTLTLPYPLYEPVRMVLETAGARIEDPQFSDRVALGALLPEASAQSVLEQIREASAGQAEVEKSAVFYTPF